MSTFSGGYGPEEEDGAGWGGLIASKVKRLLAWARGWRTTGRIEGRWYWVTNGSDVWPAIAYASGAGGWSNHDTWEDFNREVVAWKLIREPVAPND